MDFNSIMSGRKPRKRILRKLVVDNLDSTKPPLYFEVGKPASKRTETLGIISAIIFLDQKSIQHNDLIHRIIIRKPNNEEYDWKEIYRDRIVEFDID